MEKVRDCVLKIFNMKIFTFFEKIQFLTKMSKIEYFVLFRLWRNLKAHRAFESRVSGSRAGQIRIEDPEIDQCSPLASLNRL